jgi:hypothetical protein
MSADNVLPRGTFVRLDVDSYLEELQQEGTYTEVVEERPAPQNNETENGDMD